MSEAMTGYDVEVKHMFMSPVEVKEEACILMLIEMPECNQCQRR